jgi:hypothetical protein
MDCGGASGVVILHMFDNRRPRISEYMRNNLMRSIAVITWTSITFPVSLSSAAMPTSRDTPRPSRRAITYEPSWITETAV